LFLSAFFDEAEIIVNSNTHDFLSNYEPVCLFVFSQDMNFVKVIGCNLDTLMYVPQPHHHEGACRP
jgi:hypothetical protein